jgi:ABC-type Fe3+-siderophore transport system permease subunit
MKRTVLTAGAMLMILLLLTVIALKYGTIELPWTSLGKLFTAPDDPDAVIIRELRLVRTLAAILSGAALGTAGAILQKILHNDLASPDLLGISAGAGCAGITLLLIFPAWASALNAVSFAGALLAAALICLAAWRKNLPQLLRNLQKSHRLTIIAVMHDFDLALHCADIIMGIKNGKTALFSAVSPENLDKLNSFTAPDTRIFTDERGNLRAITDFA